ncbi:MAG: transglutaminase-like domain-containing protein [Acidobacteriia bacterium]|nr:transglutaminase-like domain-containing protein [Terriglobia bacterium]
MQASAVRPYQCWHWAGDEIVQEPIIPASRKVPGSRKNRYEIDIREFLSTETNAVVRNRLRELASKLPTDEKVLFRSRTRGGFDLRARRIAEYVGGLAHLRRGRAAREWLFPDETLANGGGDCEDLAFLLAAMLEASGISPYCIRVALGVLVDHTLSGERRKHHDHAWVMYYTEGGAWQILEPVALPNEQLWQDLASRNVESLRAGQAADLEYVPHFVFNRHHLWNVRTKESAAGTFTDYVAGRRHFWDRFDPTFAAGVHNEIFDEALKDMPWLQRLEVKAMSLAADANVIGYHPFDHFDTAYIDGAWARVQSRLACGELVDFARAVHAVGDFYAHTFYGEFTQWRDDHSFEPLLDRLHPRYARPLEYDFNPLGELPGCAFGSTPNQAAALWEGRLISGQWLRWYVPFPDELTRDTEDFARRRCLPDHDAVAVDGPAAKPGHKLYTDKAVYSKQFDARRQAAIEHISWIYKQWPSRT